MRKATIIICLCYFITCVVCDFNLTIVHIADFHSHWFEYDENKTDCSPEESKGGNCFGGFPRLLTFVREIREKEKNVLVLSSGEFFLGRSLHALHGWKLAQLLLPRLELDAMSLSNHDFDSGVFELSAFLYAMKFPVLCANMWARNTSFLYSRVNKSVVIEVGGEKIGIVGYIHQHALNKTKNAVSVKFLPEIPALKEEVNRLESEGINKIIALGHAGYYTDLEIAENVKGLDIVMGGDSDIMLFDPGSDETDKTGNVHGNYPRVHNHEKEVDNVSSLENKTLVLHIPQHGLYIGVLRVTFDDQGKIIHESGEPVLMDNRIPQDEDALEFLEYAKGALEQITEHSRLPARDEVIGEALGYLDGNPRNCRMAECSLGNFIADAFLHEFTFHYRNKSEHRNEMEHWGPIDAVVYNSGPIMHSIEPGPITIQHVLQSVFLGGFIKRVHMSGQQLLDMMEHSVKHYDTKGVRPPGAFLQIAGLKVEYDLSQMPGNRVKSLIIRCRDCGDDDHYLPVKPFKTYIIGMPNFLRDGRDGFYDFEIIDQHDLGQFDAVLIVEYLRRQYFIEPKLDERIKFYHGESSINEISSADAIGVNNILSLSPVLKDLSNSSESNLSSPFMIRENISSNSTAVFKNMSIPAENMPLFLSNIPSNTSLFSNQVLKNNSIFAENNKSVPFIARRNAPSMLINSSNDLNKRSAIGENISTSSSVTVQKNLSTSQLKNTTITAQNQTSLFLSTEKPEVRDELKGNDSDQLHESVDGFSAIHQINSSGEMTSSEKSSEKIFLKRQQHSSLILKNNKSLEMNEVNVSKREITSQNSSNKVDFNVLLHPEPKEKDQNLNLVPERDTTDKKGIIANLIQSPLKNKILFDYISSIYEHIKNNVSKNEEALFDEEKNETIRLFKNSSENKFIVLANSFLKKTFRNMFSTADVTQKNATVPNSLNTASDDDLNKSLAVDEQQRQMMFAKEETSPLTVQTVSDELVKWLSGVSNKSLQNPASFLSEKMMESNAFLFDIVRSLKFYHDLKPNVSLIENITESSSREKLL